MMLFLRIFSLLQGHLSGKSLDSTALPGRITRLLCDYYIPGHDLNVRNMPLAVRCLHEQQECLLIFSRHTSS